MSTDDHVFGGAWTEVKLRALHEYMEMYNTALAGQPSADNPFYRWYIDAFAGTGRRTTLRERGGIFEGVPSRLERVMLDGSARRAISVAPAFDRLVFIEQDAKRFAALTGLKTEFPDRRIHTINGDANDQLERIFSIPDWADPVRGRRQRGIVFLDPYGMNVRWSTLTMLAETRRVDVWYLFPLNAVVRQAARNFEATDEGKRRSLTEIFGTEGWKDQLYSAPPPEAGLFSFEEKSSLRRDATPDDIQRYARDRLKTIFRYVSQPLPLTARSHSLFSLFCLSNNHSGAALALIDKLVSHVVNKYTMASHRTSGRRAAAR